MSGAMANAKVLVTSIVDLMRGCEVSEEKITNMTPKLLDLVEDFTARMDKVENVAGSDRQETLVEVKEMNARLEKELGRIDNAVSGLSSSVSTLSIKESHVAYKDQWTSASASASAKITFDRILASVGQGEFNAGTGIFKCGQAGTYSVSWSCLNWLDGGGDNEIFLFRNGSRIEESLHLSHNDSGNQKISYTGGKTMILSLTSGDQLWLQTYTFTGKAFHIHFNVQLVAAEFQP